MYAVYHRQTENDRAWKRVTEIYRNKKGLLVSRDKKFETIEQAKECASKYPISKIKEVK